SLRTSKNRLRSYAGAAAAAAAAGNAAGARSYYAKLVELADGGTRPEIVQAKAYLPQANRERRQEGIKKKRHSRSRIPTGGLAGAPPHASGKKLASGGERDRRRM